MRRASNKTLSLNRSKAVIAAVSKGGIIPSRTERCRMGGRKSPWPITRSEEGRAKNRRGGDCKKNEKRKEKLFARCDQPGSIPFFLGDGNRRWRGEELDQGPGDIGLVCSDMQTGREDVIRWMSAGRGPRSSIPGTGRISPPAGSRSPRRRALPPRRSARPATLDLRFSSCGNPQALEQARDVDTARDRWIGVTSPRGACA